MVQTLHAGLSDQALSRYLYDLGHSPPNFEQYTRWPRDVRPNDTVQATNLREIRRKAHQALFTEYIDELSRAIDSIEFSNPLSHPAVATRFRFPLLAQQRLRALPVLDRSARPLISSLRPQSPEKHSQKRHQSYGHH